MNYWERFKEWCKNGDSKKDFISMWEYENPKIGELGGCTPFHKEAAWQISQLQKKLEELHINLRDFKHEYYKSVSKTQ